MTQIEQTDLFQLATYSSIDGIGRRTLRKVLQYRSERKWCWSDLWVPSQEVCRYLSLTKKQIESIKKSNYEQVRTAIKVSLARHKLRLIGTESEEYPPLLKEADDPPPVLFVKGAHMNWLDSCAVPIAIVGTRNLTAYGRTATEKITHELVDLGAVIVSGLMYGADTIAHQTAIGSGGKTVAILGYGFDHCYPPEHQPILDELLASDAATFLTEYPPWKIAKKGNFPARNSIVAGMSAAVVVTEAAAKSGSLITAQFAVEEGRAVCAVPGPITNPYCEGTKWLINEGATLVGSGAEVLEQVYRPMKASSHQSVQLNGVKKPQLAQVQAPSDVSAMGQQILDALTNQSLTFDELANTLELSPTTLLAELSQLEVCGVVANEAGRLTTA